MIIYLLSFSSISRLIRSWHLCHRSHPDSGHHPGRPLRPGIDARRHGHRSSTERHRPHWAGRRGGLQSPAPDLGKYPQGDRHHRGLRGPTSHQDEGHCRSRLSCQLGFPRCCSAPWTFRSRRIDFLDFGAELAPVLGRMEISICQARRGLARP